MILKRLFIKKYPLVTRIRKKKIKQSAVIINNKAFNGKLMFKDFFHKVKGFGRYWLLIACCALGVRSTRYLGSLKNTSLLDLWFLRFNIYAYLDKVIKDSIIRKQENGSYVGLRLTQALPARGQRTRSNSKTVRKIFVRVVKERVGRRRRRHFKNKK